MHRPTMSAISFAHAPQALTTVGVSIRLPQAVRTWVQGFRVYKGFRFRVLGLRVFSLLW